MSEPMLHSQRRALAAMPAPWRPFHRLMWAVYAPVARFSVARRLWGTYRKRGPVQ